jgi:Glycosyl transferase family 2
MSTRPLVSIGLSLSNGDRFLAGTLDSVLNQTFKNFEFIISDDCSTDRSEEICRRYAAEDERIRYYRNQRNMGAGWNARRIYELATGAYFKQATQDEMIQPDFLNLCLDGLEADESVVLAHSLARIIDEGGQFVENCDENCSDRLRTSSFDPVVRARDLLLKGHGSDPISGLVRLEALRKLPPPGSYMHSDRVLLLQLSLLGRFYEVPEHLYFSTRHMGQAAWTMPERTKTQGYRLTRRWGTLPAPGWWDPAKARKIAFPEWNVAKEFGRCVAHAPLSRTQRLRCYSSIVRWALKFRRRFARDLLVAADQLLFNHQNKPAAGAKGPARAAAAVLSARTVHLDFSTRGGESL